MSIFDRFAKVPFACYVHGYVMCWGVTDLVKQAESVSNDVMCAYGVLYMRDIFRLKITDFTKEFYKCGKLS